MSQRKIIVDCVIQEGKLRVSDNDGPRNREILKQFCEDNKGKLAFIIIQLGRRTRSLKQNAFFHGPLIGAFIRYTGEANPDYWKHYLKEMFLTAHVDTPAGVKSYIKSTSSLSVSEMSRFIDSCVNYLISEGGHLTYYEKEDWEETKAKAA